MALSLHYTDRIPRTYTLAPKASDGQPTAVTSARFALVPPRTRPTADTTWTTVTVAGNTFTVEYVRPGADDTSGAVLVPDTGADVYVRGIAGTYDDAEYAERITVL